MTPSYYRIIENFLPENEFDHLEKLHICNPDYPYYFTGTIAAKELDKDDIHTMVGQHIVYGNHKPLSKYYPEYGYLLDKIWNEADPMARSLLRIRINFFTSSPVFHEHAMHHDYEFKHKGCILYLNTCDGYTKLEDGTKIDSIRNRLLIHDPQRPHCSTNTTNAKGRWNINVNYV